MPQSNRKNRNDTNPQEMPPLNFAAAGVSAFDTSDHFNLSNNGYSGFPNAFTNPLAYSQRTNSHHQSTTFNQNPFGMTGFGMTGNPYGSYGSYGMAMPSSMKRGHSDNTQSHHQHHSHNTHHDTFGGVSFQSDPSIISFTQTATNTNPYSQQNTNGTNSQSHHNYDALSMSQSSVPSVSRQKTTPNGNTNSSFEHAYSAAASHSASDLFANSQSTHRRHHTPSTAQNDIGLLNFGASSTSNNASNSHQNGSSSSQQRNASEYNKHTFGSSLLSANNSLSSSHLNNTQNSSNSNNYFSRYFQTQNGHHSHSNNKSTASSFLSPFSDSLHPHSTYSQHHLFNTTGNNNNNTPSLLVTHTATTPRAGHSSHSKSKHASTTSSTPGPGATTGRTSGVASLSATKSRTHSSSSSRSKIHRSKSYSSHGIRSGKAFKAKSRLKGDLAESFPFPIATGLHKASKMSKVNGVARISLHYNPPVDGCAVDSHVILATNQNEYIVSDDRDCKYTWYRSKQYLCSAQQCKKPALMHCLTCSKLQIDDHSSYYCSTKCMQDCWSQHHAELHQKREIHLYDEHKWNADNFECVTNEWIVRSPTKGAAMSQSEIAELYCKFPPPLINKWEKIHADTVSKKEYTPTKDDIGRQLLLHCVPIRDAKKDKETSDKEKDKNKDKGKDEAEAQDKETVSSKENTDANKPESTDKDNEQKSSAEDKNKSAAQDQKPDGESVDHTEKSKTSDSSSSDSEKKIDEEAKSKPMMMMAPKYTPTAWKDTSPCLPRPDFSERRNMKYYHPELAEHHSSSSSFSTFKVMSYNCLAPIYCTRNMYPYVAPYQLNWDYRKYNIKREILRYKPEVICLQEVQQNHFDEFFLTEFKKEGYEGMYMPKTRGVSVARTVDGCCIFFKKDRFRVQSRYHIDFNDTSRLYLDILREQKRNTENYGPPQNARPITDELHNKMMKRLIKGNIALIVVLEELEPSKPSSKSKTSSSSSSSTTTKHSKSNGASKDDKNGSKKSASDDTDDHKTNNDSKKTQKSTQESMSISDFNNGLKSTNAKKQICIATTHVFWDPAFTDVKLWQSWILCEEISRALPNDLPLILCGDFNSEPKSAVYDYLTKGRVDSPKYDELARDYELLPPQTNLRHRLGLKSHYNLAGNEPEFTNYTENFKGCLDYILYSSKSLEAIGFLQEYTQQQLLKEEAFPNDKHSSDHIPILGTFAFASDYQGWLRERRTRHSLNASSSRHQHASSSSHHHHHHSHAHGSSTHHHNSASRSHSAHHHHSSHQRSSSSHYHTTPATANTANANNNEKHSSSNNTKSAATTPTSTIRPSPSAPRHQRPPHHPPTSPPMIQSPSPITKSASSTVANSSMQPSTPQQLRRHHSVELNNNGSGSQSTQNSPNRYPSQSRSSNANIGQYSTHNQSRSSRSKRRNNNNTPPRNL